MTRSLALTLLLFGSPCLTASDETLAVDLILNGGFELVADSTTTPPKYGAHWKGAFSSTPGDSTCLIVMDERGGRALRLRPDAAPVSQIVTPYGPHASDLELVLDARAGHADAILLLRFETQSGRAIEERIALSAAAAWSTFRVPLGALMTARTERAPDPWCRLTLSSESGTVRVDDVFVIHRLPRVAPRELRELLMTDLRDGVRIHVAPLEEDEDGLSGLGLVDAETGYQTGSMYDVRDGAVASRSNVGGIGGAHGLMLSYLQARDRSPEAAPLVRMVEDRMRKHLISLLRHNIYKKTGLYCLYNTSNEKQLLDQELVVAHFIGYCFDVAEVLGDEKLQPAVNFLCAAMADAMVKLRDAHDLPTGVIFGREPGGNWFGRMPEKVSAHGVLAPPKKSTYDQAWAISQNRSWYHDFDTLVGLMRVWGVDPKPSYAKAVEHVLRRFDREWDATRYDMENDTDDHYGKNVEAALLAWRHSGYEFDALRDFAQAATDHRLERDVPWGENVWLQGIRLGSFTTADQPRAYRGPIGLHEAPSEQNPATSGYAGYRHALREMVKSDLKRRILDDGWMNDASSLQWEMVVACFDGNFIGPCADRPASEWEGDMGDQFAGPSANGFRAIGRTLEICRPGRDLELLAWYAAVHKHTVSLYRHPYGYAYGMPKETAARYGGREQDQIGFIYDIPYGMAAFMVHGETLASLDLDRDEARIRIEGITSTPEGRALTVRGPPSRAFEVVVSARERFHHAGTTDWRVLTADPDDGLRVRGTLDETGTVVIDLKEIGSPEAIHVDALLLLDDTEVEDVASARLPL